MSSYSSSSSQTWTPISPTYEAVRLRFHHRLERLSRRAWGLVRFFAWVSCRPILGLGPGISPAWRASECRTSRLDVIGSNVIRAREFEKFRKHEWRGSTAVGNCFSWEGNIYYGPSATREFSERKFRNLYRTWYLTLVLIGHSILIHYGPFGSAQDPPWKERKPFGPCNNSSAGPFLLYWAW